MKRAGGTCTCDMHVKKSEQDRENERNADRYRALGSVEDERSAQEMQCMTAHAQDFTRLGDELI